MVVKCSR